MVEGTAAPPEAVTENQPGSSCLHHRGNLVLVPGGKVEGLSGEISDDIGEVTNASEQKPCSLGMRTKQSTIPLYL